LPQVFGEFHRRHPGIDLQLEIANTRTVQDYLMEGRVEIGLTEGLIQAEHFDSEVFQEDELAAIAPRGHPLLKRKRVTVRELCREPFVAREEGSGTRAVVEQALAKRGVAVKPVLSLASTEAIKRAVIAGVGIAIVSRLAIGCELQFGSLAVIPIKDLVIERSLHLQRIRGKRETPALAEFLKILASWKKQVGNASH
jgi:DNA-binding transcriptional LysR family regulator